MTNESHREVGQPRSQLTRYLLQHVFPEETEKNKKISQKQEMDSLQHFDLTVWFLLQNDNGLGIRFSSFPTTGNTIQSNTENIFVQVKPMFE